MTPHLGHTEVIVVVDVVLATSIPASSLAEIYDNHTPVSMPKQYAIQQAVTVRTFAGPAALTPSVLKLSVARISALFEPGATAHATTALAGFPHDAALGTRRSHSWYACSS